MDCTHLVVVVVGVLGVVVQWMHKGCIGRLTIANWNVLAGIVIVVDGGRCCRSDVGLDVGKGDPSVCDLPDLRPESVLHYG